MSSSRRALTAEGAGVAAAPDLSRTARLKAEYRELRDDERWWTGRAVSLGSFYLIAVGTTAFFLLKNEAVELEWVGIVAPIPSFGIIALAIRQAITATVRGRLLLAYERALIPERTLTDDDLVTLTSGEQIPIGSSFHAQQPWLQDGVGRGFTWFERAGLVVFIAVCYLSVRSLSSEGATVAAIMLDAGMAVALFALGFDGLAGHRRLEQKMAEAARKTVDWRQRGSLE